MNDASMPSIALRRVVLASESDFLLAGATVQPSFCEVLVGGRRVALQPRVMQVLVALARANGRVLSRDELIAVCWENVGVSEDAIQRCIAQLRRRIENDFQGALSIETVPRVGYRLVTCEARQATAVQSNGSLLSTYPARPWSRLYSIWTGGMAAVVLLTAFGLAYWLQQPRQWRVENLRMLPSTVKLERYPAISPDGRMVAYAAGNDVVSRQIFTLTLSDNDIRQITHAPGDNAAPTWSPDGKYIAYINYRPGEPCRIMIMTLPSGTSRELARCRIAEHSSLSWSAAANAIYFIDAVPGGTFNQIMRLDLGSAKRSPATHPPAGSLDEAEPAVSPDGDWLAFSRNIASGQSVIAVLNLKTGKERVVQRGDFNDSVAWASDSQSLFGTSLSHGDYVLWDMPLTGSKAVPIYSSPFQTGRVASGPAGLLVAEIYLVRCNLAAAPRSPNGEPQFIDRINGLDGTAAFSPGGALIWANLQSGHSTLWTMPPGAAPEKLADLKSDPRFGLQPSPDGSKMALVLGVSGKPEIRIVDRAAATVAKIVFSGMEIGPPAWSADGRSVLFPGHDKNGWRIWRTPIAHPASVVAASPYGWFSVRTYNNELYGQREGIGGVWRIDETPHQITQVPMPDEDYSWLYWTIFRGEILYLENAFGSPPRIVAQPTSGGPTRVVADVPNYCHSNGFDVNPRTGQVVYTASRTSESDIELLQLRR